MSPSARLRSVPSSLITSRVLAAVLVAGMTLATHEATYAQSPVAQAQSLFDQGRELLKAGHIAEACAAFTSSHKLDPAVTTLLNLADCRAKNGQLASAWGHFVEAQRMARASGNDKLARVATKHADRLRPRLSKLTISVTTENMVPGLVLMRGAEAIDPAIWNHPLPIDGGEYSLAAKAPGYQPWTTSIDINPERDVWVINIPRLASAAAAAETSAKKEVTDALPQETPEKPGSSAAERGKTPRVAWTTPPVPAAAPTIPADDSKKASSTTILDATAAKPSLPTAPPVAALPTPPLASPERDPAFKAPQGGLPTSLEPAPAHARSKHEPAENPTTTHSSNPKPVATQPKAPITSTEEKSNAKAATLATSATNDADLANDAQAEVSLKNSTPRGRSLLLPVSLGVSALALTGAAAALKLSGDSYYDDAKAATTQTTRSSAYDAANLRRHLAIGLGATAIACAGSSLYFFVTGRGEPRQPSTTWTPMASPQHAGVALSGTW